MRQEEMDKLEVGDTVRHKRSGEAYVIVASYGTRRVAVRSIDVSNALEWELFSKSAPVKS